MALANIKTNRNSSGFTIVELLIVIVVIAILATISIVSYTGIQNRAKTSAAQANAVAVQKAAEAYFAENSSYPRTIAEFNASLIKYPSNVTVSITDPAGGTNGERAIEYHYTPTAAPATGARIRYWDYQTGAISTNIIYLGGATSGSTYNTAAL